MAHFSNSAGIEYLSTHCRDWQVDWYDQLSSTNRYAAEFANRYQAPAVIIADQQTFGRGRGRNSWSSQQGALTFSLIIEPEIYGISAGETHLLSLVAAAVVRKVALNQTGLKNSDLLLKWPNDLYLSGRKVCGILLEQTAGESRKLVVGIGLNVNNSVDRMPPELQSTAIALCDQASSPLDATVILGEILRTFQRALTDDSFRQQLFPDQWRTAHILDDRIVTVKRNDHAVGDLVVGRCEGIDEDGALLLRDTFSTHRIYSANIQSWE